MDTFRLTLVKSYEIGKGNIFLSIHDTRSQVQENVPSSDRNNSGRPMIVFDVMGLLNITLQSNSDIVQGGRHHLVLKQYEEFFQKLKANHDAELVFFCDGRVQQVRRRLYVVVLI